ncbi:cupin-like domain-containing protein [Nitrospirillum pindoramense]|uniref:Cupin-like protein n=1 Tax=Nitrospirillum amazonense TaxID=28077 RepID=A0A560H591_9PROT|nr:cupin-like domain-containing protein [Nitrospirillum amazonense]TWB40999.1 cupin-like protein [Nitrospirillum amazonense]
MTSAVDERDGRTLISADQFREEVVTACRPLVLRDLVAHWPAVDQGGPGALRDYLARFGPGIAMETFVGPPDIRGRYFYADGLKGFNFERRTLRLAEALDQMVQALDDPNAPTLYAGSLALDDHLPGFTTENVMPLLPPGVAGRIWLGHASRVATHYDAFENLACIVAGTRRFTLYPPSAVGDLYVGPIDNTLSGQPVSLAASDPDNPAYPRFQAIRDQALVADLNPGDALFLPKLWWHQVEATAPFNGMVNYWWDAFAAGPDAPFTSLLLAMITLAERPEAERQAWRAFFDHYVFRPQGHPLAHLPAEQHGVLGPLKAGNYGRLRARVMQLLRGG